MTEMKKTVLFAGVAVLLVVIAYLTAPVSKTPDAFFDVGEEFFPDFVDPNEATGQVFPGFAAPPPELA